MTTDAPAPDLVLQAAEDALSRAHRAYAKKLLRLAAAAITDQHPEAVRLDVFTGSHELVYLLDSLRDAAGELMWVDPGRLVVVRETADDELGGTVTIATRDVRELVTRAFDVYEGPVARLLRHDPERDIFWLELRRP